MTTPYRYLETIRRWNDVGSRLCEIAGTPSVPEALDIFEKLSTNLTPLVDAGFDLLEEIHLPIPCRSEAEKDRKATDLLNALAPLSHFRTYRIEGQ